MTSGERALRRIERFARLHPDALRLARLASLAVRIEPHLLRSLRTELVPGADVGAEADVWFSSLVESRGAQAIVLEPVTAEVLRFELAQDTEVLTRAAEVTFAAHRTSPDVIRLEERVTFLALHEDAAHAEQIEKELVRALHWVRKGDAHAKEVASWALRALPRFRAHVRQSRTAIALALSASVMLGRSILRQIPEGNTRAKELGWALPEQKPLDTAQVEVDLMDRGVRFSAASAATKSFIELPRTEPLVVEVEWEGTSGKTCALVEVLPERTIDLGANVSRVTIRTLAGTEYLLEQVVVPEQTISNPAPKQRRPPGTEPTSRFKHDVYVSYARQDNQFPLSWVDELVRHLSLRFNVLDPTRGVRIFFARSDVETGTNWSTTLQDAVTNSALFLAIVSPSYVHTEWCHRELDLFLAGVPRDSGRVFLVQKLPVEPGELPEPLRDLVGFRFFEGRERPLELSNRTGGFEEAISRLAYDIRDRLRVIANSAERETGPRTSTNDPKRGNVDSIDLPHEPSLGIELDEPPAPPTYNNKAQAFAIGSQLVEFSGRVPAALRPAIINSVLLAQLAANKELSKKGGDTLSWYAKYNEVLANVGWVIEGSASNFRQVSETKLHVYEEILPMLAAVFGPAAAARSIIVLALRELQAMNNDARWLALFDRASQRAHANQFQLAYVDAPNAAAPIMKLASFELEAKNSVTQVLFFKFGSQRATLRHYSSTLSVNSAVFDGVQAALQQKVAGFLPSYVTALDI